MYLLVATSIVWEEELVLRNHRYCEIRKKVTGSHMTYWGSLVESRREGCGECGKSRGAPQVKKGNGLENFSNGMSMPSGGGFLIPPSSATDFLSDLRVFRYEVWMKNDLPHSICCQLYPKIREAIHLNHKNIFHTQDHKIFNSEVH